MENFKLRPPVKAGAILFASALKNDLADWQKNINLAR